MPDTYSQLMGETATTYRLEPNRRLDEDQEDFSFNVWKVRMPGLDGAAMMREGNAILSSEVRYDTRSYFSGRDLLSTKGSFDPPFNNATVAMLVLVAGMPAGHQQEFRQKYFRDRNYDWRSGRSPFLGKLFSRPEDVFEYCLRYVRHGEV